MLKRFRLRLANVSSMRFYLGCIRYVSKQVLDAAFRKGWNFALPNPCTWSAGGLLAILLAGRGASSGMSVFHRVSQELCLMGMSRGHDS